MDIAFAIMFFLVGAFTNEVWRSILGVGFTVKVCRDTVYQTFRAARSFEDHTKVILAYQRRTMINAGMTEKQIEDIVSVNETILSTWKQAIFAAIMAEVPVLVKDHFVQNGWADFDSIFEEDKQ